MKITKIILFSCFFILCIAVANIIRKNADANKEENAALGDFVYYEVITISNNDLKSLARLSFNASFDNLSKLFETNKDSLRNNVLKKDINLRGSEAELIVFMGDNAIRQITVYINDYADDLFNGMISNLTYNDIELRSEIIDDADGNTAAEIYFHETENYKFIMTKAIYGNSKDLALDYINLKIL